MDFTKANKTHFESVKWSKKTDGFSFKKLGTLFGEGVRTIQVFGFFFTKSDSFGLQPVAITSDCLVNLPTSERDTISEMLKDKETVKAIDNGECSLKIREYQNKKYKKTCYAVEYINTPKTDNSDVVF